eukprot:6041141-Ditylum_brightwellii.AAC.1
MEKLGSGHYRSFILPCIQALGVVMTMIVKDLNIGNFSKGIILSVQVVTGVMIMVLEDMEVSLLRPAVIPLIQVVIPCNSFHISCNISHQKIHHHMQCNSNLQPMLIKAIQGVYQKEKITVSL